MNYETFSELEWKVSETVFALLQRELQSGSCELMPDSSSGFDAWHNQPTGFTRLA
jgi:hypothetical protein